MFRLPGGILPKRNTCFVWINQIKSKVSVCRPLPWRQRRPWRMRIPHGGESPTKRFRPRTSEKQQKTKQKFRNGQSQQLDVAVDCRPENASLNAESFIVVMAATLEAIQLAESIPPASVCVCQYLGNTERLSNPQPIHGPCNKQVRITRNFFKKFQKMFTKF